MFSLPSFLLALVLLSLTIVSGAPNNQNNQGNDNKVNKCLDSFRYVGNSAFSFAGSSKANLALPVTFDLNKCSKIDSVDILIGHDGQTKKCNSLDFRYLHSGSATVTCDNIKGADLASDSYTYTVSVQKDKTTVSFGSFKVDIYCESGYTAGSSSWHKRNNGWSGGYNNGHDNDNKKCVPCPWGTYSDGKSECKACDKGSEPPKGGSGTCVLCPAGQSSDGNNGKCYDCPKDTFAAYPGSAKCKPCEHGHKCGKGSKQCYPEATQYWHRRSALERARRCPPTYISCSVSKEQWECVDAMNDIQSCGGCWSEGTGQDCTLLLDAKDRHASVACVKGQCKVTSFLPNFKR